MVESREGEGQEEEEEQQQGYKRGKEEGAGANKKWRAGHDAMLGCIGGAVMDDIASTLMMEAKTGTGEGQQEGGRSRERKKRMRAF